MLDSQCCFCGDEIDRNDESALMVSVENLWRWVEGAREKDVPFQTTYAHSRFAKDRTAGATMQLEPSVFGEEN